jgi:hypothetical protein
MVLTDQLPPLQPWGGKSVRFLGRAGELVPVHEFRDRFFRIDVVDRLPPPVVVQKAPDDVYMVAPPEDARLVLTRNGTPAVAWTCLFGPHRIPVQVTSPTNEVLALARQRWQGFSFRAGSPWALDHARSRGGC